MTDFDITKYGARTSAADNIVAIRDAIKACEAAGGSPAHRVTVPVGTYKYSNIIYTTVSIVGVNSDPARGPVSGLYGTHTSAFRSIHVSKSSQAKPVTIADLYISGVAIGRRSPGDGKASIRVERRASTDPDPSYWIIRNCYIDGPNKIKDQNDSLPNLGGIFIAGGSYGLIERNTILYTHADSIHITHGSRSHHIKIQYNRIIGHGDDAVAFVTYRSLNRIHSCVQQYNSAEISRHGRSFTSIGSTDCKILYNYMEWSLNTSVNDGGKAGIMVAQEGDPNATTGYGAPGSVRLLVKGNTVKDMGGTGTGHGAIHQWTDWATLNNSGPGSTAPGQWVHVDVVYEDNQIISPRRSGFVINGGDGGTRTIIRNNQFYGVPAGSSTISVASDSTPRNFVNTGNSGNLAVSSFPGNRAIKNLGGAYTTARHPTDGGTEPIPDPPPPPPPDPVEPDPDEELPPGTVTFKNGVNGYGGFHGTQLTQNDPATDHSAMPTWTIDGDEPPDSGMKTQVLIRFDSLFQAPAPEVDPTLDPGADPTLDPDGDPETDPAPATGPPPGPIPLGSVITTARLDLTVTDAGGPAAFHRMLSPWEATDTWQSLGDGIRPDDFDAVSTPDLETQAIPTGVRSFDVAGAVQAWANGEPNYGWLIVPGATAVDGWDFDSGTGAKPPRLTVSYTAPVVQTPEERRIITGTATAGKNTLTFVSTDSEIVFRLSKTGGAARVEDIRLERVQDTTWQTGGPGTVTVNSLGVVAITGAGGTATYAFRHLTADLDKLYRLSLTVSGADVTARLGESGQLKGPATIPVGAFVHDFVSYYPPLLWLERLSAGTTTISNIQLTELAPHAWNTGGPGTVTVTSNTDLVIAATTSTRYTFADRPFATERNREYVLGYEQVGGTVLREIGDTEPLGGRISPAVTSPIGSVSFRFRATHPQCYVRFSSNAAPPAPVRISGLTMTQVAFDASHAWLTMGPGEIEVTPDLNTLTITGADAGVTTASWAYNTVAGVVYRISFLTLGAPITYKLGTVAGGTQIRPASTAAVGSTFIDFTAPAALTYFQIEHAAGTVVTVTKPELALSEAPPTPLPDPVPDPDPEPDPEPDPDPPGPITEAIIFSVQVENPSADQSAPNQPLWAGVPFARGDVTPGAIVFAEINNVAIPCQLSNRIFWRDGSLKFAQGRFLVPAIPAGGSVTLNWRRKAGTWTAQDTGLHTSPTAVTSKMNAEFAFPVWKGRTANNLTFTAEKGPKTFNTADLLSTANTAAGWVDKVMAGPVCSEWRATDYAKIPGGKDAHFGAMLYARAWGGTANNPRYIQFLFKTMYAWSTEIDEDSRGIRVNVDVKVNGTVVRGASVGTAGYSDVNSFKGGYMVSCPETGEMDIYDVQAGKLATLPKLVYRHNIPHGIRTRLYPPLDTANPEMPKTRTPNRYIPMGRGQLRQNQDDVADADYIAMAVTKPHAWVLGAHANLPALQVDNFEQVLRVSAWGQGAMHGNGYHRDTRKVLSYLPPELQPMPSVLGPSIWAKTAAGERRAGKGDKAFNVGVTAGTGINGVDSAHFPQINLWPYQSTGAQHFLDNLYTEMTLPGLFHPDADGFCVTVGYKDENLVSHSVRCGGVPYRGQIRSVSHGCRASLAAYGMGNPSDPHWHLAKAYILHWIQMSRIQPLHSTDWRYDGSSGGNARTDGRRFQDLGLKEYSTGAAGIMTWHQTFGTLALAYGYGMTEDPDVKQQAEWWAILPKVLSGGYWNDTGPASYFWKPDIFDGVSYHTIVSGFGKPATTDAMRAPQLPGLWSAWYSTCVYKADGRTVSWSHTALPTVNGMLMLQTGLYNDSALTAVNDGTKIPAGLTRGEVLYTVQADDVAKTVKLSRTKGGAPVTFTTPGGVDLPSNCLMKHVHGEPGHGAHPINKYNPAANSYFNQLMGTMAFLKHYVMPNDPRVILGYRNMMSLKRQIGGPVDVRVKSIVPE